MNAKFSTCVFCDRGCAIAAYGPEAFAVSEMPLNIGFGGIIRRLMSHLGALNYIAPVQLCMGNTAQVHRAVYGWYTSANWQVADCIVYFGQDRDTERWPGEFLNLKAALGRGATLIEVDPRITETSKLAQHHLRIRHGTDAALVLAWINVIIEEELYDHKFVSSSCIGFDELRERAAEYDPCQVESAYDKVRLLTKLDANQPAGSIRVPHGWWKPETAQGLAEGLSSAQELNDGLCFRLTSSTPSLFRSFYSTIVQSHSFCPS